jgi:ABC-type amino acid transport substrate-binding protein
MMKKWFAARRIALVLQFPWLCMAWQAHADTFRVGIFEAGDQPFSFRQGSPQSGIYPDLIQAIARESGDKIELVYVPAARLLRMFEARQLDIEIGANPAWRTQSPIKTVYSKSFSTAREILCFRQGEAKPGDRGEDFPGYEIGVQAGYVYPRFEAAFQTGMVQRKDTYNAEQLLRMLRANRVSAIILSKYAAEYYAKLDPVQYGCQAGAITDEADEMLRLPVEKADALPRINAAIEKLKRTGELKAIYARYR